MTRGIRNINKKGYSPSDTLVRYLEDRVTITNKKLKLRDAGETIPDEIEKNDSSLKKRKVEILDNHIFPSMANLVIFFEYVVKNPEIRELFEDDIKELFGYIKEQSIEKKDHLPKPQYHDKTNNIIMRFLRSLLYGDFFNRDPNNFRLGLMSDIQYLIFENVVHLTNKEFGPNSEVKKIVINHMEQAVAWTGLYSSRYFKSREGKEDSEKEPHRPIKF